jgi:2-polyprenyl-3-methyl-5-hydroxy-6-metoxy-1,4-benzoquinol methylase
VSTPKRAVEIVDRRRFLPESARGQRVLHLGCVDEHLTAARAGTGDLLHEELAKTARELTGVDISEDGIREISQLVPGSYVVGDVEELDSLDLPVADVVIAAELIEHLGSPARFLQGLRRYLAAHAATAIITTPNAYSWRAFASVAARRREVVHEDHRLVYSRATLVRTLEAEGLAVDRLLVHTWLVRGEATSRLAQGADRLLLRWNPELAVGLIAVVSSQP